MSSLYKRCDSRYYWYTTEIKGRRLRKSTRMSHRHLAKKVQQDWDLKIAFGDKSFLGPPAASSDQLSTFLDHYIKFIDSRKSRKTVITARGVLQRLHTYLKQNKVNRMTDITVKAVNGYLDVLDLAPKTKKNHLVEISLMLDQAVKEDVLKDNPARLASLPRMVQSDRHRLLE